MNASRAASVIMFLVRLIVVFVVLSYLLVGLIAAFGGVGPLEIIVAMTTVALTIAGYLVRDRRRTADGTAAHSS